MCLNFNKKGTPKISTIKLLFMSLSIYLLAKTMTGNFEFNKV